jgi:hypothetical protein
MSLKKTIALILTNSGLLLGVYLGHVNYYDINKMWLNSFEKRTNVKEGYFNNLGDLKLFYEKENSEFVPCYGLGDNKITIGNDLMPKGFYNSSRSLDYNNLSNLINFIETNIDTSSLSKLQKNKFINRLDLLKNNIKPIDSNVDLYFNNPVSDSLDYLINVLDIYHNSNGVVKDAMKFYIENKVIK